RILEVNYSDVSEEIARFLTTLRKPSSMALSEYYRFKSQALQYFVREGHLYRRADNKLLIRLVINGKLERYRVISECHKESGHRGPELTYYRLAKRFFWRGAFEEYKVFCKTCEDC
ncbi:hypothetical protein BKA61DRAFT_467328, partial [Leptodontidium sp. MPI-SDFR-AT-0119]